MARIRSVKPELWTDPEFVECSLSARLLFIAMWNFASDYGVIPNKPRQIRMQCLPADDCEIDALIEELVSHRFIVPRTAPNGDEVLVIRTFVKNQKINRATLGRWGDPAKWPVEPPPNPPLTETSLSATPRMGRDNSDNTDSSDHRDSVSQPPAAHSDHPTMEERIERIAHAVLDWRITSNNITIGNRTKYAEKAIPDILEQHGKRCRELIAKFPYAPVDSIVHALETGETRNLAMFAADDNKPAWDYFPGSTPANGNVVEMPARKLDRAERVAALRDNGAPARFVDPGANPL